MESIKKYCLVVGGAGGIGIEIAKQISALGLIPIITYYRNKRKAEKISKEFGGLCLKFDLRKRESIISGVEYLSEYIIKKDVLEILILAASPKPEIASFLNTNGKYFENLLQVNVIGNAETIKQIIKKFFIKEKRGLIITILTQAMDNNNGEPTTGMSSYIVSKYGLQAVLKTCAVEHKWLKFITVSPGLTDTPMLKIFEPRYLDLIKSKQPIAKPEDVANNILKRIL